MALSATGAEDVTNVPATLARKRAPAFSFEQIEDESTAQEAAADAHRIHRICTRLVAAIEWELPEPNERPPERTSAEGELPPVRYEPGIPSLMAYVLDHASPTHGEALPETR